MNFRLSILFPLFAFLLLYSCVNTKTAEKPFQITAEDSLQCLNLSISCMDSLKCGNIDGMLDMCHTLKNDTLFPLHSEQKRIFAQRFRLFPVLDYEMTSLNFDEYKGHFVDFRVKFAENSYTNMRFNLVTLDNKWYLVIVE